MLATQDNGGGPGHRASEPMDRRAYSEALFGGLVALRRCQRVSVPAYTCRIARNTVARHTPETKAACRERVAEPDFSPRGGCAEPGKLWLQAEMWLVARKGPFGGSERSTDAWTA